jgi:hypothetical protein
MGAQESIPTHILLHPRSSHDVPEERRVEARRQGAIDGGGEAMRAQATHGDQEDRPHPLRSVCPGPEHACHYPVKDEKVSTPGRRSMHIRAMKRKDYKDVSPEPKDYGGVTISMIVARARGRPP